MPCVVFVKTSSLGDVVHHMPAVTDARRHLEDAHIVWVVEETFAPLARIHPCVDEVIVVSTRRWRCRLARSQTWSEIAAVRRKIKSIEADRIVDTQGLIRSALIARTFRGELHGYDRRSIREPVASYFYDVTHTVSRELHAIDRNRQLTGLSLGYRPQPDIDYGLRMPDQHDGAPPYAILFHGTSRFDKEWRSDRWIEVGLWLLQQGISVIIPWGTEIERATAAHLQRNIPESQILDRRPLDELAQSIAHARLVVGVDTGLVHLAAAYQVPLVSIFLASNPDLTAPIGAGPIVIVDGRGRDVATADVIEGLSRILSH